LKGNVQIVVGTPGRVMDHMRRHTLKMEQLTTIVLDEADEMLNMGFREDIETILCDIPQEHQTVLFSATMPKEILQITNQYQKEDAVNVKIQAKELTIPLVKQYYYEVNRQNKEEVTARLLDYYNPKRSLIFCNTKRMVDELAENLTGRGYFAEGLHGDLSQAQRDRVMAGFRNGTTEILIATDVAARGIDVDNVEAVFNYDVPQDIEYYVHRIGRTGRAGKKGRSFTLVSGRDIYKIREIERTCNTKIKVRTVPSAADITAAKSEKILRGVIEALHGKDLSVMMRIIEQTLDEEDCTAIEIAAAFLKQQMGEEIQELQLDEPYRKRRGPRYESADKKGRGKSYGADKATDRGHHKKPGEYVKQKTGKKKHTYKDDREKSDKVKTVKAKDINRKGEIRKHKSEFI
ncbi:MAG TPA: helicase-related protein, partial [Lachnospiraceae bacterium]|nr:helicase-related protein [Lachnospiraceae bacterium]